MAQLLLEKIYNTTTVVDMPFLQKIIGCSAATLLTMTFSMSAHAEITSTDLYASGDGLVTFDSNTGLEWIDLTETSGHTIESITPLLSSTLSGFRVATQTEVEEMLSSIMPSILSPTSYWAARNPVSPIVDADEALDFRTYFMNSNTSLFGAFSLDDVSADGYEAGILGSNTAYSGHIAYYDFTLMESDYAAGKYWGTTYNSRSSVYLVSEGGYTYSSLNDPAVKAAQAANSNPVPSPLGFSALALAMAGLARRKQAKH